MFTTFGTNRNRTTDGKKKSSVLDAEDFIQNIKNCPGKEKKCNNCGKLNHFKSVCRSNSVHVVQEQNIKQNEIHRNNDTDDTDYFIHTVNKFHSSRPNCVSVPLNIGPNALPINFQSGYWVTS
jgi:hypothetical protein